MRIVILCNDTRGGVQPYAVLTRGLVAAGHAVSTVAPSGMTHLFDTSVPVTPLSGTEDALTFAVGGVAKKGAAAAMRVMAQEMTHRLSG